MLYFTRQMRHLILFTVLCVYAFSPVVAQVDKKSLHYFDDALTEKAARHYTEACIAMVTYLEADPTNADAYSILGQWYFEGHDFDRAVITFRAASDKCHKGHPRFARALARSLVYAGLPEQAFPLIAEYGATGDTAEWRQIRDQAAFVKNALAHPGPFTPGNLGMRVNTEYPELFPSMAVDTQSLFFTRRIKNMDEDLYYAMADSCGGWFRADNAGDPPNTPNQESSQFVSADGHYLFYTRCENRSENGWAEGGCDMFIAYRVHRDSAWTIGQPFGQTINTTFYEGMPSLSPDNRELYFVSDRTGGYGGYDIWVSSFEDGLWQKPRNAGPGINTPGNETAPFIAADNKTLIFTSDYRPGMGGTDLFMSKRQQDGKWGMAENLGYPINTAYDEKSAYLALDGHTLFFASDRSGPAGNYDIYRGQLPGSIAPASISYLMGYVQDSITGERLNSAAMLICSVATGDTLYELRSNRGDASYVITLEAGHTYAIHTSRVGYQPVSDTVIFGEEHRSQPLKHNVAMLVIGYNPLKPIHDTLIASVNFDAYVTELSKEDKQTISDALSPWLEEKEISVSINAYTDNTGNPMLNESLSYKRAAIVAKEVLSLGVDPNYVSSKGWGEANPIADNETEEGRYKNRRVEIVVKRY